MAEQEGLIPPHGGYRKLRSFRCARQVYDLTVAFCGRFIDRRSRTHASLEELLLDYEDFIRQRGLRLWPKDSPEALRVRQSYQSDASDLSDMSDPETAANTLICLINQASYLLGRQIRALEEQFLNEGGLTERLYRERRARRDG